MATKHPKYPANAYVSDFTLVQPAMGSRLYEDDDGSILVGQPPEVLKGLLLHGVSNFDTLVLPDVKEKGGSLINSLEFPLYSSCLLAKAWPKAVVSTWWVTRQTSLTLCGYYA